MLCVCGCGDVAESGAGEEGAGEGFGVDGVGKDGDGGSESGLSVFAVRGGKGRDGGKHERMGGMFFVGGVRFFKTPCSSTLALSLYWI